MVPRTLPPCGLPRLLPLDLPLVDVVVSFHRASPSLSLDWSSELSLCSIALSEMSESSESELGSNISLASSPSSPSKSEISLSQSCELLPQCNILFFSQPCCYPSADVLAILSEKWLNGRLKCKDWFTYAISKYPSGHLNRKFEEKQANSSDISKRTMWKNSEDSKTTSNIKTRLKAAFRAIPFMLEACFVHDVICAE